MSSSKKDKPKHLGRGLESLLGPIKTGNDDLVRPIPIAPFLLTSRLITSYVNLCVKFVWIC